ncbi:DUF262 domain-containing protein [Nitrospirillum sp. BR 11828]|uniref:DUF262 domain-containing protein n=1 Tax=Nitrospirillum sp. BR 11828 TaxID=3104325 RepID=UPI002ACACD7F|nr:DUF262 domain-containing protein [Nitrospirillum sp. BR 11828]MDZ5647999.1 DUF262 domain-containing protein [Nitrospirillum sp. BR 11828]
MSIDQEVAKARKDIRTDDYQMSIGEWVSLYENEDLDIHPEFQRLFRWTDRQKSNLIESILLGIPLPPIFVSQRENGVWDVIDGLQRLSTIFQLMGILKDQSGKSVPSLELQKTKYLPSLAGMCWDGENELPPELKRIIRRSKIGVSIILRESDENTKYDLFERLNTGGTKLTDQEVRNCILVMADMSFYEWLHSLTQISSFAETTSLSEKLVTEKYDMELALRYLLFSEADAEILRSVGDVGSFLSEKMIDLAKSTTFDRSKAYSEFKAVFDALAECMHENAFKRYSPEKGRHEGAFLVSVFEAVTAGVSARIKAGKSHNEIPNLAATLWTEHDFTNWARSGVTAARRLSRIIPFAREHFIK